MVRILIKPEQVPHVVPSWTAQSKCCGHWIWHAAAFKVWDIPALLIWPAGPDKFDIHEISHGDVFILVYQELPVDSS